MGAGVVGALGGARGGEAGLLCNYDILAPGTVIGRGATFHWTIGRILSLNVLLNEEPEGSIQLCLNVLVVT